MPGIQEVLIVLLVMALVFSKKIPEFSRRLGRGLFDVKKSINETREELKELEEKSSSSNKEK